MKRNLSLGKYLTKSMTYKLIIACEKTWLKDLTSLDKKEIERVKHKIEELMEEPWLGGVQVKKLKHYKVADFRLRVGEYRILFNRDLESKTVELLRILHRGKLY